MYLADTHAFVRYLLGRVPKKVDYIFRSAENGEDTIYIPTIVLAECLHLVEKGKIELDFNEMILKIKSSDNFVPMSFDFTILEMLNNIEIPELHDRIIVATARILDVPILTKDREISAYREVKTVWG